MNGIDMTTDLVPAANMAAIEAMEPATREVAVTHMLSEARQWLAHAVETTGPQEIAGFKAFLATVEESTRQLGLSKEIQLDSTEMVRRAERGLGIAIKRGQEAGSIRVRGGDDYRTGRHDKKTGVQEFFAGGQDRYESRIMVAATDAEFDAAVGEAKAEGNASRANVIRKIRGEAPVSRGERPEVLRKTRHLDSNRIVEQTVLAVEGIGTLFDQIDVTELDRALMPEWVSSLSEALSALRSLKTRIEKELNQ